jgi:hypothetical protein
MILKCLVTDKRKVTLDCAKATLTAGSKVQIDDIHWSTREVQGAIKNGLIELVGEPPVTIGSGSVQERTIKMKNVYKSKLTFECIKNYVDPGHFIHIPESKLNVPEVREAMVRQWLIDPEAPPQETFTGKSVVLEEITVGDMIATEDSAPAAVKPTEAPKTTRVAAPVPAVRPQPRKKAKAISRVGGEDGGDEDVSVNSLFAPSEVVDRPARQTRRAAPIAVEVSESEEAEAEETAVFTPPKPMAKKEAASTTEENRFTFVDIFGKNMAEAKSKESEDGTGSQD